MHEAQSLVLHFRESAWALSPGLSSAALQQGRAHTSSPHTPQASLPLSSGLALRSFVTFALVLVLEPSA